MSRPTTDTAFASLFGDRRGGGVARDDDYPRSLRYPGPLLELRLCGGRLLRARIIRPGDYIGDPGDGVQIVHEMVSRSFSRQSAKCLVEFWALSPNPDPERWPKGFPFGHCYHVGMLRRAADPMRKFGLPLAVEEWARLLSWLDGQLGDERHAR